jgi:hypothetical protein
MLEYGMMNAWDERTRAWLRDSLSRDVMLADGEEVVARMAGSHLWQDPENEFSAWRPGSVYVTTDRLLVFRREPPAVLWESRLVDIQTIDVSGETNAGGEQAERLLVRKTDGSTHTMTASQPARLRELVGRLTSAPSAADPRGVGLPQRETEPLFEAPLWYLEPRSGAGEWRGGVGSCDAAGGFSWTGGLDQRPSIRLRLDQIRDIRLEEGRAPVGRGNLVVEAEPGTFRLASDRVDQWVLVLRGLLGARAEGDREADDGARDQ